MENIFEFSSTIEDEENRVKLESVLTWVNAEFPKLTTEIKWKQPMFIDHGTFIVAFSVAKNNFAMSVEKHTLDIYRNKIEELGYETTQQLIKIKWNQEIKYDLLKELIQFNIDDKQECTTFFRK